MSVDDGGTANSDNELSKLATSPNLIEILISFKLCSLDLLDLLDVLRALLFSVFFPGGWRRRGVCRILSVSSSDAQSGEGLYRLRRAAPLVRVKAKFPVKHAVCYRRRLLAYGVFDCEFDYDSHEWSCSGPIRHRTLHESSL